MWMDLLIAALAGGFALYVWSVVCWMVLPLHKGDHSPLGAGEDAVTTALRETSTQPGWYVIPHMDNYESMKDPAFEARYKEGPNASVIVIPTGPSMQPIVFVRSFVLNIVQALGAAWLLTSLRPGYADSLLDKILVLSAISVFIQAMPPLMKWNWWKFPLRGTLTTIFDGVSGMAILGVVFHFVL